MGEVVGSELSKVFRVSVREGDEDILFEFQLEEDNGKDAKMSCDKKKWPAEAASKALEEFNSRFPEALL
jgi:hypothetical protein